jgi:hypothetical protein
MQEGKNQQAHYCDQHSGVVAEVKTLKESDIKQWAAIERIQNRLPVWGTTVISLLTFLLGIAVSFAMKK